MKNQNLWRCRRCGHLSVRDPEGRTKPEELGPCPGFSQQQLCRAVDYEAITLSQLREEIAAAQQILQEERP